jgi:hypothetical protein
VVGFTNGYLSQDDYIVHVGYGANDSFDIRVTFPSYDDSVPIIVDKNVNSNLGRVKPSSFSSGYNNRILEVRRDGTVIIGGTTYSPSVSHRRTVTLTSPENNYQMANTQDSINLQWTNMGLDITYNLQVSENSNFTDSLIIDTTGYQTNSYYLKCRSSRYYFWRVRPVNPQAGDGIWSDVYMIKKKHQRE